MDHNEYYKIHCDLIRQRVALGINNRDLAMVIGVSPSTMSNKLRGYAHLTKEEKLIIENYLKEIQNGIRDQSGSC